MAINSEIELETIKAILKLMNKKAFYGHIVQQFDKIYLPADNKEIKTAAVGKTRSQKNLKLFINEGYFADFLKDPKKGKAYIGSTLEHEILHCFPAGTMVGGSFLPIERVKNGDRIISSSGNILNTDKVEKRNYKGGLVSIKAQGILPFDVTDNHRILIAKMAWKTINKKPRHNVRIIKSIDWEESQNIKKGDWLAIPRSKAHIESNSIDINKYIIGNKWSLPKTIQSGSFPLNNETAWLMGFYCAEGVSSLLNGQITLAIHKKEKEKFGEKVKEIVSKYNIGENVHVIDRDGTNGSIIIFNSQVLVRMFKDKIGTLSHNKKIPEEILWNKDPSIIKGFLRGYFDGDGCLYRGGAQAATVSKVLSQQIQLVLARYGIFMNIYFDECSKKTDVVIHKNAKPSILLNQYRMMTKDYSFFEFLDYPAKVAKRPTKHHHLTDDFIYVKVTKTSRTENWDGVVYNLRSPSRDYTVNNIVVHNCVFSHLFIQFSDHVRGNVACDIVVNQYIDPVHDDWMTCERYSLPHGKSCYWYYEELKKNDKYQNDVKKGAFGPEGIYSYMADSHSKWDGTKGDEDCERMAKDIMRKAREACNNSYGDIHGDLKSYLDDFLKFEQPRVPWNRILRLFVSNAAESNLGYTIQKISKRYGTRPGTKQEEILNVAVTIDTSGSISEQDLMEFFNEIRSIYRNGANVTIIEADCAVCRTYRFNGKFDGSISGRGGTDLEPAMKWVDDQRKFDAHIYFTDFYAPKIDKKYKTPVLWVLTSDIEEEAWPYKWGPKVNIRDGRPI